MLESRVGFALNMLESSAQSIVHDVQSSRTIIFSDLHRGVGDEADDFFRCRKAYQTALSEYLESGYDLGLLGDIEELWENDIEEVLVFYKEELDLESLFYADGRLFRIFGNHDEVWRVEQDLEKHLWPKFPNQKVHELLKLSINDGEENLGTAFLAHGHQGSLSSDALAVISRFFVRTFWRGIQTLFNIKLTAPSNSLRLRSRLDKALHKWAAKRDRTLVICGHTHQPVFMSRTHIDELYGKVRDERDKGDEASPNLIEQWLKKIAELKKEQTQLQKYAQAHKPCYFNTGCCSFSDGQITGIELDKDMIRLVRWCADDGRKVLAERSLKVVLERCANNF